MSKYNLWKVFPMQYSFDRSFLFNNLGIRPKPGLDSIKINSNIFLQRTNANCKVVYASI